MTIRHGGIKRRKGRGKRGEGGRKHTHTHTCLSRKNEWRKGRFSSFFAWPLECPLTSRHNYSSPHPLHDYIGREKKIPQQDLHFLCRKHRLPQEFFFQKYSAVLNIFIYLLGKPVPFFLGSVAFTPFLTSGRWERKLRPNGFFSSADGDFPAYGIFSVKRVFPSSLLGNNFEFRRWDAFRGGQPGMEREGGNK